MSRRLTYRSAGVDVDLGNRVSERIKESVRRTHRGGVVTRLGLFAGGLSLPQASELRRPALGGAVGFLRGRTSSRAEASARIVQECLGKLHPAARPVAFLDYVAASRLDPRGVEEYVAGFAEGLTSGAAIPLIGGETAEMPGTFRPRAWEVVGALYGLADGTELAEAQPPAGGGALPQWGGGAAGWADLSALHGLQHPALVFSMDGVGTKARLAVMAGDTGGLALDIVHHSMNDILCQGARGLAFLFYLGCGRREESLIQPVRAAAASLRGRLGVEVLELALGEHPGRYRPGELDLCASVAGVVDAPRIVDGSRIEAGDLVVGLPSSGLHTNGYSLARKALLERGGLALSSRPADLGSTLGEALLEPHRNYAPAVLPLLEEEGLFPAVRGIAHVTGGGIRDNLARVLPDTLGAEIRLSAWEVPPLFRLIQRCGDIPLSDLLYGGMVETFNMGLGLLLVLQEERAGAVLGRLREAGEASFPVGRVVPGRGGAAERVRLLL